MTDKHSSMIAYKDGETLIRMELDGNPWILTRSGRVFWLNNPESYPDLLSDIAWSLSMQCRFCGHSDRFYSVAEHSYRMAAVVPQEHALAALLHDASEAFISDIPRPVKRLCPDVIGVEMNLFKMIEEHFGVHIIGNKIIEEYDLRMYATEMRDLMEFNGTLPFEPVQGEPICPSSPLDAMTNYLETFKRITKEVV